MKQHITAEQVEEVKFELITKKVYGIKSGQRIIRERNTSPNPKCYYELTSRKLTIGKMIEILQLQVSGYVNILFTPYGYQIAMYNCDKDRTFLMKMIETETTCICDALWEAVKEVLND